LGIIVEGKKYGLLRIAQLREAPAATRFLSIEPLLEDHGRVFLADAVDILHPLFLHWPGTVAALATSMAHWIPGTSVESTLVSPRSIVRKSATS
jgi:hypothetical protein